MNSVRKLFFGMLGACLASSLLHAEVIPRTFPVPDTASPQLQALIATPPANWDVHPKSAQEWQAWTGEFNTAVAKTLPSLRQQFGVTSTASQLAGVPIFTLMSRTLPAENSDRVLLNLHGGGYVLGAGEAGTVEAVYMAGIGGYRVIAVDYRMPPDFPYPAALDDAFNVYKALLETTPADKIGVFGTSTGGGMTLALMLRIKQAGLPLPAAIAPGTPWTDLTKTGDSYFTNEGVDNVLVSYDGWLGEAAKLYANGHDLKDPMLSPVYGDVSRFPPTLLTSGTRDLFLSNTVRMHLKLRQAGIQAALIVFEGMSHAQYHMDPNAPETQTHFTELKHFFSEHLK
ncbi:acetyl esterase/lipase [Serratia fonticola]|uniref:Acetyl esterase/lipase n=1 Tax=Serratia fonticola TaxID=47917 RepID=A0A542D1Y4_SERFO|nr:alpha/beta hydrolase [Serratia fonticola]TQI80877.1 acetyl esterase/lipase [Serratia fonticola]TQI97098.1 acetyl esterase/lipase [Serratia fonticola]TVZ71594.1 acetyl esterase/lipase [Serratia fonticola]